MPPQKYPFSKNLYFSQKRMRAEDFIRDQEFADGKLAFLSRWLFGEGAAAGLGVQRADQEILVRPGFAVDPWGRYVIVDEMVRCRLGNLDGLDRLSGENAVLWLSYDEEAQSPMLVSIGGSDQQKNTVARERFRFFLRDASKLPAPAAERALFSNSVLFEDDDLRLTQSIPCRLPANGGVEVRLIAECYRPQGVTVSLAYRPQVPGFTGKGGGAPELCFQQMVLPLGETVLTLPLLSQGAEQTVQVSVEGNDFTLEKGGRQYGPAASFRESFPVSSGELEQALVRVLAEKDLSELWESGSEGVPLAYVRLLRLEDRYMLDEVAPLGQRYRAQVPWLTQWVRRASRSWTPAAQTPPQTQAKTEPGEESRTEPKAEYGPEPRPAPAPPPAVRRMTTGVVFLDTALNMEQGRVIVSDEISHELGPGPVFVSFGIEELYPAVNKDHNDTDVLLGDTSLFAREGGVRGAGYDWGVRIRPEKGTFELALRLREPPRRTTLRVRWYAWMPDEPPRPVNRGGTLVSLDPGVSHVKPGETVSFTPVFEAGRALPCEFTVEGRLSGRITREGRYTAPERVGLFTVCAQVKGDPKQRVKSYVIVDRDEAGRTDEKGAGDALDAVSGAVGAALGGGNG